MRKCKATSRAKTKFKTEREAGRAMMRFWSHDSSADIYDLHTYRCPACGYWHFGHISYYEKHKKTEIEITDSVSIFVD